MSKLYDAVHAVLAKGPRSTEDVVAECRRPGLPYRPETIELFLQLAQEIDQRHGWWVRRGGSSQQRIVDALQQAFAGGQTYLPIERIGKFLDGIESATRDDIVAACEESGLFRVQDNFILRT